MGLDTLLENQLSHWQKLHIHSLSTLKGLSWAYFSSMGRFLRYGLSFKLAIFGYENCHWPRFQKLHIYVLSTPRGRTWTYFRSTGSRFWDTGQFSNLPYLGMKLGHWRPRSCTYTPFLSQGIEIELIFALRAAVSEIWANFQNCHIWAWNLGISQSSRSCTYIT